MIAKKAESGINVITGRKVVKINAARQEAELDNGRVITYGKCLLATGGKPKVGGAARACCTAIDFAPKWFHFAFNNSRSCPCWRGTRGCAQR